MRAQAEADERAAAIDKESAALKVHAAEAAQRARESQEELAACRAESAEYLKEIDSLAMEFDRQQETIKALVADIRSWFSQPSSCVACFPAHLSSSGGQGYLSGSCWSSWVLIRFRLRA